MQRWTELKCYSCSRVCGEAPGKGEELERLQKLDLLSPGRSCSLANGALRCVRCGTLVYPGDTYAERPLPEDLSETKWGARLPGLHRR